MAVNHIRTNINRLIRFVGKPYNDVIYIMFCNFFSNFQPGLIYLKVHRILGIRNDLSRFFPFCNFSTSQPVHPF
ncbi:hypothetical protein D3C71_1698030 [compost metagenome]